VYDAGRVRLSERIRNLGGVRQRILERKTLPADQLSQSPARHELHGNKLLTLGLIDVVNRNDVRVIQGRGGLRFLYEPPAALRIRDFVRGQDFQGDKPVEVQVLCFVDDAHASGAELPENAVV
jgi:hypothetical protein